MDLTYDAAGRRKYLNESENERFLAEANKLSDAKAAFCLTIYYTGCRISEALNLKPSNVEMESGVVLIRTLKKRDRVVVRRLPIPMNLAEALAALNGERRNQRLWTFSRSTGWRLIKRVMKNAEIRGPQASPKGLRHAFGVRSVMNQVPVTAIRKWMGHSSLETTTIYLDVQDNEQRELIRRTW
ncbi:MAG: site-specific integrase [Verrucomicrobiota bacterium]